jgi:hypothetical protein
MRMKNQKSRAFTLGISDLQCVSQEKGRALTGTNFTEACRRYSVCFQSQFNALHTVWKIAGSGMAGLTFRLGGTLATTY